MTVTYQSPVITVNCYLTDNRVRVGLGGFTSATWALRIASKAASVACVSSVNACSLSRLSCSTCWACASRNCWIVLGGCKRGHFFNLKTKWRLSTFDAIGPSSEGFCRTTAVTVQWPPPGWVPCTRPMRNDTPPSGAPLGSGTRYPNGFFGLYD